MGSDITRLTEADLFFMAFSLVAGILVYSATGSYYDPVIPKLAGMIMQRGIIAQFCVFLTCCFALYGIVLSLYYAFSMKMPKKNETRWMLLFSYFYFGFLPLFYGVAWITEPIIFSSPIEIVMVIFPILALLRGFSLLAGRIKYRPEFEYRNAHINQVLVGSALIMLILFLEAGDGYYVWAAVLAASELTSLAAKGLEVTLPAYFKS